MTIVEAPAGFEVRLKDGTVVQTFETENEAKIYHRTLDRSFEEPWTLSEQADIKRQSSKRA